MSKNFTAAEDQYITANYPATAKAEILAALPGREWAPIQFRAQRLKVARTETGKVLDQQIWTPARMAILREFFPLGGADQVQAEMILAGLQWPAIDLGLIRSCAYRNGLKLIREALNQQHYQREYGRMRRQKAAAARGLKPAVVRAPTPARALVIKPRPRPIGESANTPVLNQRAALKRMTKEQCRAAVSITADEVKKLSPLHPGRQAYTRDAAAGWSAWLAGSVR